jgi:hypothetical protein
VSLRKPSSSVPVAVNVRDAFQGVCNLTFEGRGLLVLLQPAECLFEAASSDFLFLTHPQRQFDPGPPFLLVVARRPSG